MKRQSPEPRFWRKVEKSPDCWLWKGGIHGKGYGSLSVNGKPMQVHRFSYELRYGEIPKGMFVLHRCDVPNCVRPEHLFLGTNSDNMQDMLRKGRGYRGPSKGHGAGELNASHKLTAAKVIEIRRSYAAHEATQRHLARKYRISQAQVYNIIARRKWQHVA